LNYRKEIDGLRAVAVLPVIFFHAGAEYLSGGFVGVDVFFVISGYLITTIIVKERALGTFTLTKFYERRARRILPALFFVIIMCLPFAWVWMMPDQLKAFSQSIAAITVFSSNILFWLQSGYFSPSADFLPLLHTWSLAVEEQYYLFFPLYILLTWRFGLRFIVITLSIAGVASLLLAHWGAYHVPSASFYLLPTRLWELLIGSLIAIYMFHRDEQRSIDKTNHYLAREIGSFAGLSLIFYSMLYYDEFTPFPSLFTLVPTVGAALVIVFCTPRTLVGKVLSNKILVGIGLISYSAYLWHQPLFAFARIKHMSKPDVGFMILLGALTLGLAWFSWKYIEQPFRNKLRLQRNTIFRTALVCSFAMCILGFTGYKLHGFPQQRFDSAQLEILSGESYWDPNSKASKHCFVGPKQSFDNFDNSCAVDAPGSVEYFVWGDSFAKSLSRGFDLHRTDTAHLTASGCPPILELSVPDRPRCASINQHILGEIEKWSPAFVILHANWLRYTELNPLELLASSIKRILAVNPTGQIYIVGNVPQWYSDLANILVAQDIKMDQLQSLHPTQLNELREIDLQIQSAVQESNVVFVSALDKFCQDALCAAVLSYNNSYMPVSNDFGHLSEAGASWLVEQILVDIETERL